MLSLSEERCGRFEGNQNISRYPDIVFPVGFRRRLLVFIGYTPRGWQAAILSEPPSGIKMMVFALNETPTQEATAAADGVRVSGRA